MASQHNATSSYLLSSALSPELRLQMIEECLKDAPKAVLLPASIVCNDPLPPEDKQLSIVTTDPLLSTCKQLRQEYLQALQKRMLKRQIPIDVQVRDFDFGITSSIGTLLELKQRMPPSQPLDSADYTIHIELRSLQALYRTSTKAVSRNGLIGRHKKLQLGEGSDTNMGLEKLLRI